jgi:hypothetical protein
MLNDEDLLRVSVFLIPAAMQAAVVTDNGHMADMRAVMDPMRAAHADAETDALRRSRRGGGKCHRRKGGGGNCESEFLHANLLGNKTENELLFEPDVFVLSQKITRRAAPPFLSFFTYTRMNYH